MDEPAPPEDLGRKAAKNLATPAPVLVTGSHRSGTTWVGEVLTLSDQLAPLHEPYNPVNRWSWLTHPTERWFEATTADTVSPQHHHDVARLLALKPPAQAMLSRVRRWRDVAAVGREVLRGRRWRQQGRQPLLKDPVAFFAAPWLAEEFGVRPVVLIRHPAAFAGSLKQLDWQFDFANLAHQRQLMDGPLASLRNEIERAAEHQPDILEQACLAWRAIYRVVIDDYRHRPGWIVERYEDLAADPVDGFQDLYQKLDLAWDPLVHQRLLPLIEGQSTGGSNDYMNTSRNSRQAMNTWRRRLTAEEIAQVRRRTEDVASVFYSDADWD